MTRFAGRLSRLVMSGKWATLSSRSGPALKVLVVLATHADRDGFVSMPQGQIAELSGLSRSTTQEAIADLVAEDLLWIESPARGRRPAVYRIITDKHIEHPRFEATRTAEYDDEIGAWKGRNDRRSSPGPLAPTESDDAVAARDRGPLVAVAARDRRPLLRESASRARTELNLTKRMTIRRAGTCVASGTAKGSRRTHWSTAPQGAPATEERIDAPAASRLNARRRRAYGRAS